MRSVRDDRYKYIRNPHSKGRPTNVSIYTSRDGKKKPSLLWVEWKAKAKTDPKTAKLLARVLNRPAEELYDLQQDPWEMNNLANDAGHTKTKTRLSAELDHWMEQQGDEGMKSELKVKKHKTMLLKAK